MPWQVLRLQVRAADSAALEQLLLDAGAISVTLADARDQPLFQLEPGATPLWDDVTLCGLFNPDDDLEPLLQDLNQRYDTPHGMICQLDTLEDQDWERAWMADFQPLRFGQKLWICPSWLTPPDATATTIMLDPGLAFGTGTHPTTALCLEWLDGNDIKDKVVIDYGCGSGVLSIAAALLGARRVLAVDNDPQAISATEANRDQNHIGHEVLSCFTPDEFAHRQSSPVCDILLANILAGPLQELAGRFGNLVSPGGSLVLSGILPEQAPILLDTYEQWFDMQEPVIRTGWVRLSGTRRYT